MWFGLKTKPSDARLPICQSRVTVRFPDGQRECRQLPVQVAKDYLPLMGRLAVGDKEAIFEVIARFPEDVERAGNTGMADELHTLGLADFFEVFWDFFGQAGRGRNGTDPQGDVQSGATSSPST